MILAMKAGVRRFSATILLPAGILMLSAAGKNSPTPAEPLPGARAKIIRLIEEKRIPSLSLAVVMDGEIIWEEAFGLADLERKIPAAPATLYPIASATKPITATALMILVERGLVDLDKPANAYLAGPKLRAYDGEASGATVRRILHHTSGLPMYWGFSFAGSSRARPPLKTTLERYGRLMFKPGEVYHYSNLGYAVLESIIEHVSGKSYPEFLAAEVFRPLTMREAAVFTAPPEGRPVAAKYSATRAAVPFCDHDTRGAGAIYSTARDLALFMSLHLGQRLEGQPAILKPESIAAMQQARDPDVRSSSYAFGWETGSRYGYSILTHGGVMDGCRAHMVLIPSEGLGAAVLINGENVRSIEVCDWIFAALLPEYARNFKTAPPGDGPPPPPPPFRPAAALVGSWQGLIQTFEGDIPVRLSMEADGQVELIRPGPEGAPGQSFLPLKAPAVSRGFLVIHFPQLFSTPDATASDHRTVLRMRIHPNRLSGEANTIASDESYFLPSFISLERIKPEKQT